MTAQACTLFKDQEGRHSRIIFPHAFRLYGRARLPAKRSSSEARAAAQHALPTSSATASPMTSAAKPTTSLSFT